MKMRIDINLNTKKKRTSKRKRKKGKKKEMFFFISWIILAALSGLFSDPAAQQNLLPTLISLVLLIIVSSIVILVGYKLYKKWTEFTVLEKVKKSNIHKIDKMNGDKFEEYLGHLFSTLGYDAEVTKTSGDQGADLVLKNEESIIVVQAKRYENNVGNSAVQEIYSAKNFYGANDAWVVTNSYFTKSAKELAEVNDVKLIDRDQLIELILQVK
jgi:restriction system protein